MKTSSRTRRKSIRPLGRPRRSRRARGTRGTRPTAPAAAGARRASATARTSRVPTITPSAIRADRRRLLGGADPEPDRDRAPARRPATAATSSARPSGSSSRSPVDAGVGDHVDEALGLARRSARRRSGGRRRRDQRDQREPGGASALADLAALLERQVGDDRARRAGVGEQPREPRRPARQDHVRVDHRHHRDAARRSARRSSSTRLERRAAASARVAAAWITGPSASGSENGTPELDRSAPASA